MAAPGPGCAKLVGGAFVQDTTQTDIANCDFYVHTGTEEIAYRSVLPPIDFDVAAAYGFAFGSILLAAWAFKMLIRALGGRGPSAASSEEGDF